MLTMTMVSSNHTVDGRNPKQPPGVYKTPQLVQDFSHQQYAWMATDSEHNYDNQLLYTEEIWL